MNVGFLRRQAALVNPIEQQPELKVVGEPAPILPWPAVAHAEEPASATAELRTKVFSDNTVEQNHYTATIAAPGRSLAAVMQALADTCTSIEDFGRTVGADDHLVLNIQIRF